MTFFFMSLPVINGLAWLHLTGGCWPKNTSAARGGGEKPYAKCATSFSSKGHAQAMLPLSEQGYLEEKLLQWEMD